MAKRSTVRARSKTRPTAMVAPVPSKPVGARSKTRPTTIVKQPPVEPVSLEEILQLAGNDRAYTVLDHKGDTWKVHFEGDFLPSIVELIKGKPVIQGPLL